ncbi:AaceriAFR698Cp [[Ashbya] aceris (nom. inval.)]|nr:AaceriAFR698Cp [[Ashbya] aceris (nom. inval.)]
MPRDAGIPTGSSTGAVLVDGELKDVKSGKVVSTETTEFFEKTSAQKSDFEYLEGDDTRFKRFLNSFKRAHGSGTDTEGGERNTKHENLKQTIKSRHMIMISLGTGIGTGLLVGSGTALHDGGPAGSAIGFLIMGTCVYCVIQAAGELAVCYASLAGGFNAYPSFLIDPALGFATAWVYCIQWLCVFPLELVTASITIKFWSRAVNPDVYVAIFYVLIITINFFGARGYAEAEFFFNSCKVLMMIGFFIVGILINTGAIGTSGYIGGKYWRDPGSLGGNNGFQHFKGIVATLVNAAFSLGCSEFVALTAAEQANPRKSIPAAAKKMIYKIFVVFLGSVILLGFLVPKNAPELMGSTESDVHVSPYVIAVRMHGVNVVPSFINAVILLSVLSVGNSAFYSSSRLLHSLAEQNYAPKVFKYIDRAGRPLMAMIVSILFGTICFVAASPKEEEVFKWLLAISGLSQLFTWSTICISHVRFRRALAVQGYSTDELGFKAQTGVIGSYCSAIMMVLALVGQFWVSLVPMGTSKPNVESFFTGYLAMPMFLLCYFGYKVWNKDWRLFIRADQIDLVSHRRIFDADVLKQEDKEYRAKLRNSSIWHRIADFWC